MAKYGTPPIFTQKSKLYFWVFLLLLLCGWVTLICDIHNLQLYFQVKDGTKTKRHNGYDHDHIANQQNRREKHLGGCLESHGSEWPKMHLKNNFLKCKILLANFVFRLF